MICRDEQWPLLVQHAFIVDNNFSAIKVNENPGRETIGFYKAKVSD